jgi:hemerythrin
MPIVWTPRIAVGIPQIDDEHKELFQRINRLLDAMQASQAKPVVAPLLGFLKAYVDVHFGGERALMHAHRYPEAPEHVAQHAFFTTELSRLAAEYDQQGVTSSLTIRLNKLLCDWLRDHISTTDRRFGQFLIERDLVAQP